MPDYYTESVNSESRRRLEDIEGQRLLEGIKYLAQQQAQEQQDRQRKQLMTANANQALPFLQSGGMPPGPPGAMPQPPMPGAPSQPMMPTGPAMSGGGGPGSMPMPPGAPPSPLAQNMMGPGASPSGAPAGGAGASAGPDRWKPLPSELQAPFAPGMAPQAPSGPFKTPDIKPQERQIISIPQMFETLKKAGIPEDQRLETLERMAPMIDDQNKTALRSLQIENQATKAANEAYRATIASMNAQTHATDVAGKNTARVAGADTRKQLADWRTSGAPGGGRKPAGTGGTPGNSKAFEPIQDEAGKKDLDAATWRYIQTGQYPARRGKFGPDDYNRQVNHHATEIADELWISMPELMAQSAEFKANAQSFALQTKKLDAMEGTLASFHNNIDTWDGIARGLPSAFSSKRTEYLDKLKRIDFSKSKTFNDIKLKIQSEFNDPAVAAYLVATEAVAVDWARLMQGPQSIASLTEGSRGMAEKLIAAGRDDDAREAVRGTLEKDAQGQIKGVSDQRDKIKQRMIGKSELTNSGKPAPPKAGDVEKGYRFNGGDPADQKNWTKV